MKQMCFCNSLPFSMIQQMLVIWSLVPLPFLNPGCTSGNSWFTYCWSNIIWYFKWKCLVRSWIKKWLIFVGKIYGRIWSNEFECGHLTIDRGTKTKNHSWPATLGELLNGKRKKQSNNLGGKEGKIHFTDAKLVRGNAVFIWFKLEKLSIFEHCWRTTQIQRSFIPISCTLPSRQMAADWPNQKLWSKGP